MKTVGNFEKEFRRIIRVRITYKKSLHGKVVVGAGRIKLILNISITSDYSSLSKGR